MIYWESYGILCYDASGGSSQSVLSDTKNVAMIECRRNDRRNIISMAPTGRDYDDSWREMSIEDWNRFGHDMSKCKHLKSLDFRNNRLSEEEVSAIFGKRQYKCPLECLDFEGNTFGLGGIKEFVPFLKSRQELLYLDLSKANIDDEGAKLLSEGLNHVRIKDLHLRNNNIGGAGLESLLSIQNATCLQNLELSGNNVGRQGVEAICKLLEEEDVKLQNISIGDVDIEWLKMLFSSISKNTTLQHIHVGQVSMDGRNNRDIDVAIAKEIKETWTNMVLNLSSFDAFCASNHTFHEPLCDLKWRWKNSAAFSRLMQEVLQIHSRRRLTKQQKLKRKLRLLCSRDTHDLALLFSMELIYVPHMLHLLGTPLVSGNEGSLDDVYRFLRNWNAHCIILDSPGADKGG